MNSDVVLSLLRVYESDTIPGYRRLCDIKQVYTRTVQCTLILYSVHSYCTVYTHTLQCTLILYSVQSLPLLVPKFSKVSPRHSVKFMADNKSLMAENT